MQQQPPQRSTKAAGSGVRALPPRLLWLLPVSHVLQIRNDKPDLVVAQMVRWKWRHGLSGPGADGARIADQIMQPLRRKIFGRILRQVEVRVDIGSAGAIQLVAGRVRLPR